MKQVSKTTSIAGFSVPLEISKSGDFFVAKCPQWSDCYAQGETIDDATSEAISVASSLIELYEEENIEIPLKRLINRSFDNFSFVVPVFGA